MIKFYNAKVNVLVLSLFLGLSSVSAHEGHSHKAPWEACEKVKKADECSYTNGIGDLFQGTCQVFTKALMCVRNKPIVKAKDIPVKSIKK
ncbi:MAG: Unknown protein [uncultured Sulfurovum sp.]|uniref:Uncharacterized protein n=1 Tax=uncultured Sulfurovum sp. TaxID=269237 RepID=A0A6S6TVY5_9BACT|nr:MAG: Unknown protein [uncultured Sulfurovum sp.]